MNESARPLEPGATIGVFGSGQLGRMLALAARRMGYGVRVFSPDSNTPAGALADVEVRAAYEDEDAVKAFAKSVDVATFEFENVPMQAAIWAAEHTLVRPRGEVLHVAQHRLREKTWLFDHGYSVTEFMAIGSEADLAQALTRINAPAILKTAGFGYDGKGQLHIQHAAQAQEAWLRLGSSQLVLERKLEFLREVSVVVARGVNGQIATFPVSENHHVGGVLDVSVVPAQISPELSRRASELAAGIVRDLDVVGVMAVEMFVMPGDVLVVNELAPRPHNSGHFSLEACVTCQFEQQLRAVCGLPLGSTELRVRAVAMANLMGDMWQNGPLQFARALEDPRVKLHLYGKSEARPGRKMGHLTVAADSPEQARSAVLHARRALVNAEELV